MPRLLVVPADIGAQTFRGGVSGSGVRECMLLLVRGFVFIEPSCTPVQLADVVFCSRAWFWHTQAAAANLRTSL